MQGDSQHEPLLLGRYALYEKIAQGGMASVHIGRLRGPVGFSRTVAIKRMHPQFAEDPEFVSMFLDEARLAARIRHPNVVPTLDVVTTQGELFLVMDYVQGESLGRLLKIVGGRGEVIPHGMVASLMVGVLHGLHAAHEAKNDRGEPLGIVHRDVSPQNVLVGVDGTARVLDFGVAKAAGRIQTTREGQLKGKLAYMSPEQVRGTVTRATDVYAASVVLWEALAGRRLFVGDNDATVLAALLDGCKSPPSRHVPGLPPALDAVTMRGLDPDPAKRFATTREMARALEDAVKLVAPSVIGEWVEAVAKDGLDARSARIAAIETDSASLPDHDDVALHGPAPSRRSVPGLLGATSKSPGGCPVVVDDQMPTQLSSGSVSAPRSSLAPGLSRSLSRRRWRLLAAMGGGVAVVAVVLLVLVGAFRTAAAPVAAASAVPSPPPPTPMPPTPPAIASAVAPEAGAPGRAVLAAASAPTSKPAQAPDAPHRRPPPATPAPPAPQCNPPFYFDKSGVRIFKPECL